MLTQGIKIKLCFVLSFLMGPFLAPRRDLSAPRPAGAGGESDRLLPKTNKVKGKKRCWKMMNGSTSLAAGASSLTASLPFFFPFFFSFFFFGGVWSVFFPKQGKTNGSCSSVSCLLVAARSHLGPCPPHLSPPGLSIIREKQKEDVFIWAMSLCCVPGDGDRDGAHTEVAAGVVHAEIQAPGSQGHFLSCGDFPVHSRKVSQFLQFCGSLSDLGTIHCPLSSF